MTIVIDSVSKSFGRGEGAVEVLKNLSCSVQDAEICSIVGASGSGKSTLLNCMGGLDRPDRGTITVNGTEITSLRPRARTRFRRRSVGFVFQFYNLVPDLTVQENIEVCQFLSDHPLPMGDLLKSLGLWEHRHKFPNQISGGQQQRCAIGRALVKAPGLLLCDEPTGALDYKTSKEILALFEQVNREYGCTIVIVTHNDAIKRMAHRILRLRDGELVENEINDMPIPASDLVW